MKWNNVKPRGTRILLRLDKSPRSFAGGELIVAHVPDINQDRWYTKFPKRGTVLSIGPGVGSVEPGDYVLCTPFNGVPLPREFGDDLLLIKEEFVLCGMEGGQPKEVMFGDVREEWPGDRSGIELQEHQDEGLISCA